MSEIENYKLCFVCFSPVQVIQVGLVRENPSLMSIAGSFS